MSKDKKRNPRPVIDNRQARYNFELLESFEAGLALEGWEVKGIRSVSYTHLTLPTIYSV